MRNLEEFSTPTQETNYPSLIYLEIDSLFLIENLFGNDFILQINKEIKNIHQSIKDDFPQLKDFLFIEPGKFIFFTRYKQEEKLSLICYQLKNIFEEKINNLVLSLTGYKLTFLVSYVFLETQEDISKQILKAVQKAKNSLKQKVPLQKLPLLNLLENTLKGKNITILFQPILDLKKSKVLGFEALSRGPKDTLLESPLNLFKLAEEVGLLFELEKVCREKALLHASPLKEDELLFLNIHPRTLADPHFKRGETKKILKELDIKPEQIVFEITERHSTKDFSLFFETLDHYRKQGYKIAIDDLGAGHNGLFLVGNIQPDFIKIDRQLVSNIETHPTKQALLEAFLSFAQKMNITIIAEGIETQEQLSFLCNMQVPAGQGYFLAKPNQVKIYPKISCNLSSKKDINLDNQIDSISQPATTVSPETRIKELKKILAQNYPLSSVVVVDTKQRPLGLIMSHHLDRELSTYYGPALYYEKDVTKLMDKNPLIVPHDTPVEKVANLAMQRNTHKIYDHIIVVKENKLKGIVSVQKLTNYLATLQINRAKETNPLTGLPGNKYIQKEIKLRLKEDPDHFAIIYLDIDNFKAYNDTYGFSKGDEIIQMVANILKKIQKTYKAENIFIGHIGGDDFVLICPPNLTEEIAIKICNQFKQEIPNYYAPAHQEKGFIQVKTREGQEKKVPLASISLAIVVGYKGLNLENLSTLAAGTKKLAKLQPGCCYVFNRRKI